MIVSKPAVIFHASQIFFNFLAMCCFASVAAFQAKWKVGPCAYPLLLLSSVLLRFDWVLDADRGSFRVDGQPA